MKWWLFLLLAAGCSTKANGLYCNSTCADPNTHCDTVKHECVAGAADMGIVDMSGAVDDLIGIDIAGADLTVVDLTPPPACLTSASCPDNLPVCDSTSQMCRACSGAGDDPVCAVRSAATPHCRLTGANTGQCVACNVNADCPMATPTCNPNGTCRACAANSDCDSQLCINGDGTCIPASDVYYVDASNDPGQNTCTDLAAGGKDGSLAHPYCQITSALTALTLMTRHYIRIAGSANTYNGFEITDTNGTLNLIGPGKGAAMKATVLAGHDLNAILIDPASGNSSVALVGLTVTGNGNASVFVCGNGGGSVDLTIVDSSFSASQKSAVFLDNCNARIVESLMTNATQFGLSMSTATTYAVQNCAMIGNGVGVSFASANGAFSFNTITNNTGGGPAGAACTVAAVIADSIIFNNTMSSGGSGSQVSSACVLSNVVLGTGDGYSGAKIALNPVFVGASNPHLDVGAGLAANQACCIDKINGTGPSPSPSPLPSVDFESNPRPAGAHWDIGCDETM